MDTFTFDELPLNFGLPDDFFLKLKEEDDWSFIIKLHALFEGVSSHLLSYHFQDSRLENALSQLEMSGKSTGKLAFLTSLELINKDNKKFILKLSEIRNSLVHDVRNTTFSLSDMYSSLDKNQRKQLAKTFSPFETFIRAFPYDPKIEIGFTESQQKLVTLEKVYSRAEADFKYHIWIGAHCVLSNLLDMYSYSDYMNSLKNDFNE